MRRQPPVRIVFYGWFGSLGERTHVRNVSAKWAEKNLSKLQEGMWRHEFDDRSSIYIHARPAKFRERIEDNGLCGYVWMVDNIIKHGKTSA